MLAYISMDSWKTIEAHLQTIVQRGAQTTYFGISDDNFDINKTKEAEQPLELLTAMAPSLLQSKNLSVTYWRLLQYKCRWMQQNFIENRRATLYKK